MSLTAAQMLARASVARELVRDATAKLLSAMAEVSGIVGTGHDATQAVHEARRASEIAGAKLDNLIRAIGRIPK